MGRTYTIRFKDGRVSKVSGARSDAERRAAVAFGEAFLAAARSGAAAGPPPLAPAADLGAGDEVRPCSRPAPGLDLGGVS